MTKSSMNLVVSKEKQPLGSVKPGQKLQVIAVNLTGREAGPVKKALGARLCGGTSTCLALVSIEKGDPEP